MSKNDLNVKKSFHPSNRVNQTRRYEAEKLYLTTRSRENERQNELREERAQEELERRLAEASGVEYVDRVEYMYRGPADGASDVVEENEEFLLGRRRIDNTIIRPSDHEPSRERYGNFTPAAAGSDMGRDMAAKLRDDPLLAIKRQEQAAYEAVVSDPLKRRMILAKMGRDGEEGADREDGDDDDERERRARRRREKEERRKEKEERRRRRSRKKHMRLAGSASDI